MNPRLDERVRQFRQRALVRAWAYRQRHHAHGVWYRMRRLLADAEAAYTVSAADATALRAEGYQPDPIGAELHPAKTIFLIPPDRVASLPSAKTVALRLGAELLAAECLVLTAFPPSRAPADASKRPPT